VGDTTDASIIQLFQTDPEKGYILLTDIYTGLVYTIAYNKLSAVCTKEDINEFVTDIFYDFYCCRSQLDLAKGSIKAFLSVFTKRKAINLYHKKLKEQLVCSLYDDNIEHILMKKENVLQNVIAAETKKELIEAVKALGKPDSEIVIRKFYFGQTMKDISMEIGMKQKTVEKRYERALKKLRIRFGGRDNGKIFTEYI